MNLAEQTVVAHLDFDEQRACVALAREILRLAPLHSQVSGGKAMSVTTSNAGALGWIADDQGYSYAPAHPKTGTPWPPIPAAWTAIADRVAGSHPWDCAHLVWYAPGARLGPHRDKTEAERRHPIVTICLGDDATWAVREDEREPIHRTRLRSGDVTLLAGPTRHLIHSVEGIIAAPSLLAPSPLDGPGRLAVSIRVAGVTK